ncbi:MAG: CoA transferase [Acidobacteria bacterium]|nr:CoA transferase [Acidobacteriota bacterium]
MPPLTGLRVLDLTRVLAGPYCAMMLGDMGAEVIKIEEPAEGDDTRSWAPHRQGWSTFFLGLNRSKKSLAIDLKSDAGADVLGRLIDTADVLIENFRPGSLSKLGFGYERVADRNPRLVYCSITGYGQTGPRRRLPGYDAVIQAESGLMDVTGHPDGPPTRVGVAITDYLAGLYAMNGILLALRERDRSGRGQHVDIALLDAMTSTLALPAGVYFHTGEAPGREGNQHHTLTPYETMAVRDGLVVVAAGNQRLWRQLCAAVDSSDLLDDVRYATNTDRMRHRGALIDELSRRLGRFTCEELIARLRAHTVPCGQVRRLADALEDPHLRERAMVVEIPHGSLGSMRSLGNPIRLSRTPAVLDRPPPALGEHNAEILAELARSSAARAGTASSPDEDSAEAAGTAADGQAARASRRTPAAAPQGAQR